MIGTRGHDAGGKMSPQALARDLADQEFEALQLVAYRSIEGIGESSGQLSGAIATETGMALQNAGIQVALIGSYFNLLDPRPDVVEEGMKRFKEYLGFARDFGGDLVGTETGSYYEDYTYHPDNRSQGAMDRVIEVVSDLVREAEACDVAVGIESVWSHSVSTPRKMKELLDAVDSDYIKVIFDPVNLLNAFNYDEAISLMDEAFDLYGDRIAVIHAKDFVLKNGKMVMVPVGQGLMDYGYLLDLRRRYCCDAPVIVEDLCGEELRVSREYLVEKMKAFV